MEERSSPPKHTYSTDTFEVLKLSFFSNISLSCNKFNRYIWSIETRIMSLFIQIMIHSTDTFEVLKPISPRDLLSHFEIQPIHLKYWNTFEKLPEGEKTRFNRYIWSIETCFEGFFYSLFLLFNRYIWSIETIFLCSTSSPQNNIQPIHLKYWNLICSFVFFHFFKYSTDTFEVLKHNSTHLFSFFNFLFNRYIWSIETFYSPGIINRIFIIQPIHLKYWNILYLF